MYYASLLVVDNNCKHLCQFEGQTSMLWRRGLQFSRVSRRILPNALVGQHIFGANLSYRRVPILDI